jgi:hypothetical protein
MVVVSVNQHSELLVLSKPAKDRAEVLRLLKGQLQKAEIFEFAQQGNLHALIPSLFIVIHVVCVNLIPVLVAVVKPLPLPLSQVASVVHDAGFIHVAHSDWPDAGQASDVDESLHDLREDRGEMEAHSRAEGVGADNDSFEP